MKWSIDYLAADDVLLAHVSETVTLSEYKDFINDFWRKGCAVGCHKLLADLSRIDSSVTLLDIHEMPDINLSRHAAIERRSALYFPPRRSEQERDKLRYLAHWLSAGGLEVEIFDAKASALAWLKGQADIKQE